MRAWIEMLCSNNASRYLIVALFMRAWIEICGYVIIYTMKRVALFMRAWIEITKLSYSYHKRTGRPLHEGVDWNTMIKTANLTAKDVALFMRAWIEICILVFNANFHNVALFMRAWIEIEYELTQKMIEKKSPSSWGRGLKSMTEYEEDIKCRPLHEGVDWNNQRFCYSFSHCGRPLHEGVDWNIL